MFMPSRSSRPTGSASGWSRAFNHQAAFDAVRALVITVRGNPGQLEDACAVDRSKATRGPGPTVSKLGGGAMGDTFV
ncbi:hypothetical protein PG985_002838 [Apiospora marii]|uniref:uncharacterized protein n=1 Tax=Apiospora marii TaxID=335849 RepID=UPI00312DF467